MTDKQLSLFPQYPTHERDLFRGSRIGDIVTLFQQHLVKGGKSDHTVGAFTSDLQLLIEHQGAAKPIGRITTRDLNEFLHWMEMERGVSCSRKTYARRVTTLKVFFKWLYALQVLDHDPAGAVLQRSGQAPLALILDDAEVEAALAFAHSRRRAEKPDARPALLFTLLLDTGIKKNEAMRLQITDITRTDPPELLVRQEKVRTRYKERRLPLDPAWLRLLSEYAAQYPTEHALFGCSPRNLEYVLEDVSKGAALDKKISFEMMRWTFAVRAYVRGEAPHTIREALGLSPISWHETFAKITRLADGRPLEWGEEGDAPDD
jgi:integrase/recombinase XerD